MKIPKHVTDYIEKYKSGNVIFNKERIRLVSFLEDNILQRDDLYFDDQKIEDYIKFSEKWFFKLQDFQKFISCFVFLYEKDTKTPYFSEFFISMARGGGKNGYISTLAAFFMTPLHGIPKYNMSVVANSEKQARVSFREIYEMIESNNLYITGERPNNPFYLSKVYVEGTSTKSQFLFDTSNEKTKDGAREGCIFFDEVHAYEKDTIINIKRSGLGKVAHPRTFYIGTDGYVREGFLDRLKERADNVLKGINPEDRLFPFICKIDDKEEIDKPEQWEKKGLLTIVDEPTINPKHIIDWFIEAQKNYGLQKVVADNFRMDLLRPLFEDAGIEYEVIKNTRAIQSLLAPRVEDMFAQHHLIFGDNPLMRWYTQNVAVKIRKDGNKEYEKKEPIRRKTDGFQALIHALYRADDLKDSNLEEEINLLRG